MSNETERDYIVSCGRNAGDSAAIQAKVESILSEETPSKSNPGQAGSNRSSGNSSGG